MDGAATGPVVRPAGDDEAAEVARVWLASRHASVPRIPAVVHSDEEVTAWFESVVFPSDRDVWVAEEAGRIVAVLVTEGTWIDQLYVLPGRTGRGLGSHLVDFAKARQPRLRLWTFESNLGARRFYERHGFVVRGRTDGDNEEGAPDVLYEWSATTEASTREPLRATAERY